jgi:hypothetical protein
MPHLGQSPGFSDSTPGHIGQKYLAADAGMTATESWGLWPQQDFGSGMGGLQQLLMRVISRYGLGSCIVESRSPAPSVHRIPAMIHFFP